MTTPAKYALRFFVEWNGGCLWPGDTDACSALGSGPLDGADTTLPLSPETVRRCGALSAWHDTSRNLAYLSDPSPWRQPECDRFNAAAAHLLATVRAELGTRFEVADGQPAAAEDPDLDAYLANPTGFRRPSA